MKKITDSYLKKHLKQGLKQLTPDAAEQLWEKPVQKAAGNEWYLDGVPSEKSSRRWIRICKTLSAVAACFVLGFLFIYINGIRTDATVYLDVNPAIEMKINRREKVISAEADNRDGHIILEDMDLENVDLDVAVNAVLGSMVKHGYLSEAKNMVLLSVDSRRPKRAEELKTQLSGEIHTCLESLVGSGAVFAQEVQVDEEQKTLAKEYGMTPGKAALLQKLTDVNKGLDYEELAEMSVYQLKEYLKKSEINLEDFTSCTGTVYEDAEKPEPTKEPEPTERPEPTEKPESKEEPEEDSETLEIIEEPEEPEIAEEPETEEWETEQEVWEPTEENWEDNWVEEEFETEEEYEEEEEED